MMKKSFTPSRHSGFTLVELMIAVVLGLLIVAGVIGVFLSNKQVYRQNENVARLQESARYANEVMSRDIREAGGIACGSDLPTANVVNNPTANWWSNWGEGIHGYESGETLPAKATGTGTDERVAGTDAVIVWSGDPASGVTIVDHDPPAAQFKVNISAHGFADGDVLLGCDLNQAAIFQVTNASDTNVTIVHNTGTEVPGNCSKGLGFPTDCSSVNGNPYTFAGGGIMNKLASSAWYIGYNGRGGKSLYKANRLTSDEVAEGITDLQIQYLVVDSGGNLASSYIDADSVADWTFVVGTRLIFTIDTLENIGTDGQPITRTWNSVITLRNRRP